MLRISIYQGKSDDDLERDRSLATPFIEETANPNVDVSIGGNPYSDRDTDPACEKGEKLPEDDLFDPETIKEAKVVGIDFDGTLNLNPEFFAGLMKKIQDAGGKCILITGRPESEIPKTHAIFEPVGIKFDEEHYYPSEYTLEQYFAEAKDWDEKIAAWKVSIIKKLGLHIMIDDMQSNIDMIEKNLPDVLVLKPVLEK